MSEHARAVAIVAVFIAVAVAMELLRAGDGARADTEPPAVQAPARALDLPRGRG